MTNASACSASPPRSSAPSRARPLRRKLPNRVARAAHLRPRLASSVLTQDPHERLLHTYGKSYPETVRAFARDFANAPDYVALPETEADIAAVFDWASGAKVAVVPFGAGSSVVGGVEPWSATHTRAPSASTCGA